VTAPEVTKLSDAPAVEGRKRDRLEITLSDVGLQRRTVEQHVTEGHRDGEARVQPVRRPVERPKEEIDGASWLRHADGLSENRLWVRHVLEGVERADEVELRVSEGHVGRVGLNEAHASVPDAVIEQRIGEVESGGLGARLGEVRADHAVRAGDLEGAAPGPLNNGASTRTRSAPRRSSESRS
jgi:hypothetical protein